MKFITVLCLLVAVLTQSLLIEADVYIHNMRGSNNRLNEANVGRNNANRLFDSQNNNNGGYNVGVNDGYLHYYTGSKVMLTWTNQHGCGVNNKTHCELVVQYMCRTGGAEEVRDGTNTNTPSTTTNDASTGLHETRAYYSDCTTRKRNGGLFTADQNLKGTTSQYTRQNPNGNRRGLECPEERDYYPYWHPSPWKDIVIMTSNVSRCEYYQAESQNVKNKGSCSVTAENNPTSCATAGGTWTETGAYGIEAPECILAPWSRDNHLGNGAEDLEELSYNWTIPDVGSTSQRCVLRLRYNISTGDYPWETNSSYNGVLNSPVTQNPDVNFGLMHALRLAINTAQFGRTFQDRTHVFYIDPTPTNLVGKNVWNINVRGKRGNIVQVYPAVEYDFVPNQLTVAPGDYVIWQWTGSNTNPANFDGQGPAGYDRSNIVQIATLNDNFPLNVTSVTMFDGLTEIKKYALTDASFTSESQLLATFNGGPKQMNTEGTYHYMCTRNNNFTNRSQKATLIVAASAK